MKENKMQKPVWRMNTGAGVPSDLNDEILFTDLTIRARIPKSWLNPMYWDLSPYETDLRIYAYQTTRTKAAKYRRVECDWCVNGYELTGISTCDVCRKCKGNGFYWEKI